MLITVVLPNTFVETVKHFVPGFFDEYGVYYNSILNVFTDILILLKNLTRTKHLNGGVY